MDITAEAIDETEKITQHLEVKYGRPTLKVGEVAKELGVSTVSVWRMTKAGLLKRMYHGSNCVRFRVDAVARYIVDSTR
ncbi:MAG: helix-turn-helix domain-containing protein [Verrucomicrobiota bacterium]